MIKIPGMPINQGKGKENKGYSANVPPVKVGDANMHGTAKVNIDKNEAK